MSNYDRRMAELAEAVAQKVGEPVQACAVLVARGIVTKQALGAVLPSGAINGAVEGAVGYLAQAGIDHVRGALGKRVPVHLPDQSCAFVTPTRFGVYGLRNKFLSGGWVVQRQVLLVPRSLVTRAEFGNVRMMFGDVYIELGDNREIKATYHRVGVKNIEALCTHVAQAPAPAPVPPPSRH